MMDLNVYSGYNISQAVATIKGATYIVTFQLNHHPRGPTNTECVNYFNGFVQLIGTASTGTTEETKFFSHSAYSQQWNLQYVKFTARSTSSILKIGSTTPGRCGPVIDDIKMVKA